MEELRADKTRSFKMSPSIAEEEYQGLTIKGLYQKERELVKLLEEDQQKFKKDQRKLRTLEQYIKHSDVLNSVYLSYQAFLEGNTDVPRIEVRLSRLDDPGELFKYLNELHINKLAYWDGFINGCAYSYPLRHDCKRARKIFEERGWKYIDHIVKEDVMGIQWGELGYDIYEKSRENRQNL